MVRERYRDREFERGSEAQGEREVQRGTERYRDMRRERG